MGEESQGRCIIIYLPPGTGQRDSINGVTLVIASWTNTLIKAELIKRAELSGSLAFRAANQPDTFTVLLSKAEVD